jgi:UDP-glucuronate decarboxylase
LISTSDPIVADDLKALRANFTGDQSFDGQRILITGGAGFIGSWLSDFLLAQGALVTCLDDMSTGVERNVRHLMQDPRFKFVKHDITEGSSADLECDLIFHLACHPSPEEYQKNSVTTIVGSSHGTMNMLEVARKNDAVLLYASTSEVYGDAQIIPTPESYWGNVNPIGPRSCYDEGKRFAEALCVAYNRTYGLDVRTVRIFNTYGPRLRADGLYARALSRFITQALSGADLTVYGDGKQTRSFCYITDTVLALLLAAIREEMKAQIVNVGNPNESTILSLAETIIRITGSKSKITYYQRPVDDPQRRCPDISRANTLLCWFPRVELNEGLSKTIRWFVANENR